MEINEYLQEFDNDWLSTQDVREKANEEYRFVNVAGAHWEGWLEDAYEKRAKLEMNHISEYCRRTYSQWINNRQTVNYSPADDSTSDDDADLLDGLIRRDLIRNGGQAAIDTAVKESYECGMGAIILNTQYEDEFDDDVDYQNIVISEQPNAYSSVVFDSASRRADKADAKRCVVLTPYSRKVFEEKWPTATPTSVRPDDKSYLNSNSDANGLVWVATRYDVDVSKTTVHTYTNPIKGDIQKIFQEDLEDSADELEFLGYKKVRSRSIKRRCVYKTVFSREDILEPRRKIVGKYIPVIPFYGFRCWVDGVEQFNGLARERMDVQRVLNMAFSLAAESAAHASDSKPIFDPDQMDNPTIRGQWANNLHQQPYLLVGSLRNSQGDISHAGPIGYTKGTELSPSVNSLIQMAGESLQRGTGGAPQDIADPNASGKAINALIKRIDQNTEAMHENTRKAITHWGVVYESMAREVYGGAANAGRKIKILNERNEPSSKVLTQAGVKGDTITAVNDLSKSRFEVVAGHAPDYQTEDQETFDSLKDIIGLMDPQDPMRNVLARSLFLLKDAAGLNDLQDYVRRELMISGYIKPETEEDKQVVIQAQQGAANQVDPNVELLEAAAAEQESKAMLNQANAAKSAADAAKKTKEIEKLNVDIAREKNELVQSMSQ